VGAMKTSDFFYRLGGSAWLLTVGLSIIVVFIRLVVGQWIFLINESDWRTLWLLGGGGGGVAFLLGGFFAIWEAPPAG
jgi:hypothetical protein